MGEEPSHTDDPQKRRPGVLFWVMFELFQSFAVGVAGGGLTRKQAQTFASTGRLWSQEWLPHCVSTSVIVESASRN